MKLINTKDAVGHVLCHDHTQILTGDQGGPDASANKAFKGVRFKKGHVVEEKDIEILLSMGKEHLYVWEKEEGMLHEDEAAERLIRLCQGKNLAIEGPPHEGKLSLIAEIDGLLQVDSNRLVELVMQDELMVASLHGNFSASKGQVVAATRVIPLIIDEKKIEAAEELVDLQNKGPIFNVLPYILKRAAIIATGSELNKGLIQDRFSPKVKEKLTAFGIEVDSVVMPGDERKDIISAIKEAQAKDVDLIICTGGMSVDPDDNTPGAIAAAGADIVSYGAPVLPGSMLLVGKIGRQFILGLPGCVMYNKVTVFDLVLPRIAAGILPSKRDLAELAEGGLCMNCEVCTFLHCPFGR